MEDAIIRDFFLGFIKLHILYHSKKEEIYGQEFRNELQRHGYEISFGTLYPIFHKLEKRRYLSSRKVNVKGKIRKYYSITDKGNAILKDSKHKTKELFNELYT
ncbi:MAG: PadR family transcriptional regulator [Dehalococcoidia bacterium]|jgi:PadR family transcriptional regulator, regulatory protein PadR|nr:MAG: PadR family transcriptional regulator [Dehalococcoidia bacterium]